MKSSFSIGRALSDGLGLIIKKPVAILVWGVVLILPTIIGLMAFAPMMQAAADPATVDWDMMLQAQGWSGLSNVAGILACAVVGAAVIRVVLKPARGALGGLRLGLEEFYYILVQVVIVIGVCLAVMLVLALAGALAMAARSLPDGIRIAIWIILGVVATLFSLWMWARTGLISVATVERRELAFEAGWAATRGQTVRLIIMGLISWILSCVVFGLIMVVAFLPLMLMGVTANWSDWETAIPDWSALPISAWIAGGALLVGVILGSGAMAAIAYAPWASAWRQLRPVEGGNLT
jgi:hypothetical protein